MGHQRRRPVPILSGMRDRRPLLRPAAMLLVAALLVSLLACGNQPPLPTPASSPGTTAEPAPSDAPGTTPAPATPPASVAPEPTPDPILPAGVEFSGGARLPGLFGSVIGEIGSETVFFGIRKGNAMAARLVGGAWKVARIDDESGIAIPSGTSRYSWSAGAKPALEMQVGATATRDGVMVATGVGHAQDAGRNQVLIGFIWSTTDGVTWGRFDPRDILGGRNVSVLLSDVTATADGFVAVGSVVPVRSKQASELVVLRSTDGKTWSVASRLSARWSLGATAIRAAGSRLVLEGYEATCDPHGGPNDGTIMAKATRLWQSPDDGATWIAVDLAGADPALAAGEPGPANASACPDPAAGYTAFHERFATRGSVVGLVDGRLVAVSEDGGTLAVASEDLSTWTLAPVPGAIAAPGPDGMPAKSPLASLMTSDASAWILRSLQHRRDAAGAQLPYGCEVRWWRSTDHGVTWVAGVAGRPVKACSGGFYSLRVRSDGSVLYFMIDAPVTPNPGGSYLVSTGGPVSQWDRCTPGPQANCAFVTMAAVGSAPGQPAVIWPGIDLSGARLTGAALAGADLSGANLTGAVVDGDLSGAKLAGASLGYATITGKLAGADLSGITSYATVFGGDLTGAKVKGGVLTRVTFLPGTTCPDGRPSTSGEGAAACRLR